MSSEEQAKVNQIGARKMVQEGNQDLKFYLRA